MLRRLASFCYRRRWRVLIAWVVVLVGVNVLAQTVGGTLLKTFSLPGSESQKAFDALERNFGRKGDTGQFVFKVKGDGTVTSPAVVAEVQPVLQELAEQPHVVAVTSPYDPANAALHLRQRKDRVRGDPVRRAVERRARQTSRRTCATS